MDTQHTLQTVRERVATVIVGQHDLIDQLLISLLSNGHVLLEGVPGVAKTLTARLLARLLHCSFARIQFTPDLMPADIVGTSVFDPRTLEFQFRSGPVFANVVLADEINRAPAKTQSALFEAMEERQVTVDGTSYPLPLPFMVLATQNPIEQEGTYRLPEAQLDRFLMKILITYPTGEEEQEILRRHHTGGAIADLSRIEPLLGMADIEALRSEVRSVTVEESIMGYITAIAQATRNNPSIDLGASPRASIGMLVASKARAVLEGRTFVIPDDVQMVARPVLRHRIQVSPEREMEGFTADQIIGDLLRSIDVPR
jgi:MoxR-like ATPase